VKPDVAPVQPHRRLNRVRVLMGLAAVERTCDCSSWRIIRQADGSMYLGVISPASDSLVSGSKMRATGLTNAREHIAMLATSVQFYWQ